MPGSKWTQRWCAPPCSPGIREQGDAFPLIADPAGKMIVGQFGSFIDGFPDQL